MAIVPETHTFWTSKNGVYSAFGGVDVEGNLVWSLDDRLQSPGDPPSVRMNIVEVVDFINGFHKVMRPLLKEALDRKGLR